MRCTVLLFLALFLSAARASEIEDWQKMKPLVPRGYVCHRASAPINVDGKLDDAAWKDAAWSEDFADIEGAAKPAPRFRTRMKMLWDDDYLYVAAELLEPHVWGTITEKNAVIFLDNDFEVFIDPDGDNHSYHEFEMNALNTIWELDLPKPYKDGAKCIWGTNLEGLKSAVHVNGTLNDPSDTDAYWTLEIAFPWKGLAKYNPGRATPPREGDQWRAGFSRVEWRTDIVAGKYVKVPQEKEDNWIWSPVGIIDMHRPERWGYIEFSTAAPGTVKFQPDPTLPTRDALMEIYHYQKEYFAKNAKYAATPAELGLKENASTIRLTDAGFEATLAAQVAGKTRTFHTQQDSRLWEKE